MNQIHRGNFESTIWFLEHVNILKPDQKVLELGSGNGTLVDYLHKKGFSNVIGTEIDTQAIKYAQNTYGVTLQQMRGEKLDFSDNTFDAVVSFDVFEHIADTKKHLQEVNRVLKIDGYYLFGTPNKLTNIPFEILKERSFTKYKEYHVALHTYWELRRVLSFSGFDASFVDVPVVNEYFTAKIRKYAGSFGVTVLKYINPDKVPIPLKTNFYVVAQKL